MTDPARDLARPRVFIAGIMQGSHLAADMHGQDYRLGISRVLLEHLPEAEVYDPRADHSGSLSYDDDFGREVFFRHNRMCAEVDLLVAFAPEASMGTAIEMWEAYRAGARVVTISPLVHNWAVKFLSHRLYADLAEFARAAAAGELRALLAER
jgi:hypothetical protein